MTRNFVTEVDRLKEPTHVGELWAGAVFHYAGSARGNMYMMTDERTPEGKRLIVSLATGNIYREDADAKIIFVPDKTRLNLLTDYTAS